MHSFLEWKIYTPIELRFYTKLMFVISGIHGQKDCGNNQGVVGLGTERFGRGKTKIQLESFRVAIETICLIFLNNKGWNLQNSNFMAQENCRFWSHWQIYGSRVENLKISGKD